MDEPDPYLSALLKAEADRYQPDHERIMRRIRNPEPVEPVQLHTRRSLRDSDRQRRAGLVVPVVAASLVALIAGAIAAVDRFDAPSPKPVQVASEQTPSDVTPSTTGPPPATSDDPPTTPGSEVGAPVSSAAPTTRAARTTEAGEPSAAPAVEVDVAPARAGKAVSMPNSATDWIVAGALPENTVVRHKDVPQLISGPHVQGNPKPAAENGPFSVSWTGGMPKASGTANKNWYVVKAPVGGPESGMFVRAPAEARTSELTLTVGAVGVDGRLEVSLDGKNLTKHKLKAGPTGYTVTIRFHTTGGPGSLTANLVSGAGGSIGLASAVLD